MLLNFKSDYIQVLTCFSQMARGWCTLPVTILIASSFLIAFKCVAIGACVYSSRAHGISCEAYLTIGYAIKGRAQNSCKR